MPVELKTLQLGHMVRQEQKQEQHRTANSPHKTQSDSYQSRKRELVNKYQT